MIGAGGREHALAWKLAQSASFRPGLDTLYAAPGNPGIARHATIVALDPVDHDAVVAFAREKGIGLVVIGPEAPLVAGLGDALRAAGVPVFGPSATAARLEGSKGFTKDLCRRANIPTAGYVRVTSRAEADAALASTFGLPVVIKADGLAAGKGVTVAFSRDEAAAALDALFAELKREADPDKAGAIAARLGFKLVGHRLELFGRRAEDAGAGPARGRRRSVAKPGPGRAPDEGGNAA